MTTRFDSAMLALVLSAGSSSKSSTSADRCGDLATTQTAATLTTARRLFADPVSWGPLNYLRVKRHLGGTSRILGLIDCRHCPLAGCYIPAEAQRHGSDRPRASSCHPVPQPTVNPGVRGWPGRAATGWTTRTKSASLPRFTAPEPVGCSRDLLGQCARNRLGTFDPNRGGQ